MYIYTANNNVAVGQISMDSVYTFCGAHSMMSRDITLRGSWVKGIPPRMALSYKNWRLVKHEKDWNIIILRNAAPTFMFFACQAL